MALPFPSVLFGDYPSPSCKLRHRPFCFFPLVSLLPSSLPGRAEPIPPRIFVLYLALAGTCLVLLILPLEGQPSPLVPPALHVTLPQKLVAAYVLGLLTMAFLRS